MRTEKVFLAIGVTGNRYEVCHLTSKGVHVVHKPGERMQDSINQVLGMLSRAAPVVQQRLSYDPPLCENGVVALIAEASLPSNERRHPEAAICDATY